LLEVAPKLVKKGGVLVVLTYHSLEDRPVKRVMKDGVVERVDNRAKDVWGNEIVKRPWEMFISGKKASGGEVEVNSRARSARLRAAKRM